MIPSYNHRFLLVTQVRSASLQAAQLGQRLNAILDRHLHSRCRLLFCDEKRGELGWLVHSDRDYRGLDAGLARLARPDSPELQAAGLRLERFELFEQYQQGGLAAAWRWCRSLAGRMRLRLLMQV
ncbi:hypothetical protein [Pseudomonas chlororaphis]|uniref:hypothetical protein n=1 Tax=Pseudomonas chlororaphis TaxID=587753 RepID=UPI0005F8A467|nr:hypothetical protein [Pseudomonas chlororaphis]